MQESLQVFLTPEVNLPKEEFNQWAKQTDIRWNKTVSKNGEVEYTLSEYKVREYLIEIGKRDLLEKVEKENKGIQAFSAGVTKEKKNSLGGWDVYVSKLVAQTLAVGGSAAIGFLVALIPGIGWSLAGVILCAMLAHLSTSMKHGNVFRFNEKFGLVKVWNQ